MVVNRGRYCKPRCPLHRTMLQFMLVGPVTCLENTATSGAWSGRPGTSAARQCSPSMREHQAIIRTKRKPKTTPPPPKVSSSLVLLPQLFHQFCDAAAWSKFSAR